MTALSWVEQQVERNNATLADLVGCVENIHEDFDRLLSGFESDLEELTALDERGDTDAYAPRREAVTNLITGIEKLEGFERRLYRYKVAAAGTQLRLEESLHGVTAQME